MANSSGSAAAAAAAPAGLSVTAVLALTVLAVAVANWLFRLSQTRRRSHVAKDGRVLDEPPMIPYTVPFIGSMVTFGMRPLEFLREKLDTYGDCFTFLMFGRKMTYVLGPDGNNFLFNAALANVSAEEAYKSLTVPVFGPEVVYDVENAVLMEQKRFVKDALNTTALKVYVGYCAEETRNYFDAKWPLADKPQTGKASDALAQLIIYTASRCLFGKEIRDQMDSRIAQLYHDLDDGFTPVNFLFEWLPLPSFYKRDAAHMELRKLFMSILRARKEDTSGQVRYDMLSHLMDAKYKSGEHMSETAVACFMIAILMAGSHTSSATSVWMLMHIAQNPEIQEALIREQSEVLTGKPDTKPADLPEMDYESLKKMELLDACLKETLRIHPPIIAIMRKVIRDVQYKDYVIPAGNFVCASPAVGQLDERNYPNPYKFDPYRFFKKAESGSNEWVYGGFDVAEKSAKSNYLPFGAGRHRCIGESFAYVQIKSIIATLLRTHKLSLPRDPKTGEEVFPTPDFARLFVLPMGACEVVYERR
ncbi:cytochrome P450 [Hyaloraphidium curvatum]|nr:cytochrome P450 [Hyaloraphidium curvatum]